MEVKVVISDYSNDLKYTVERELNNQLNIIIREKLKDINFTSMIEKQVNYLVNKSQYVSDSIIRNLVQQRIAKEITKELIPEILSDKKE